jgi:DeoR family transcriptional regulator, glycerol-3-phosphate regulon repressor
VITNSIMVAREMWSVSRRSDVYLLGGRYSGENHETVGPHAIEEIQRLHADHAVLTIGAIDPTGIFMDYNADEAYVARAMMAGARQTTVLADNTKLGRRALFQVCEARQVDRLVTDRPPPLPLVEALRMAGVDVLVADVDNSL